MRVVRRSNARLRAVVASLCGFAVLAGSAVVAGGAAGASTEPIGTVVEYDVGSSPGPMILASDGSVWTGGFAQQLIQITSAGQVVLRDTQGAPIQLVEHPIDTIWFGTFGGKSVGRFQAGAVDQFETAGDVTGDLVVGPDGKVWFSDSAGGIGSVTMDGTVFENQTHGPTRDLIVGPNGNVWFADVDGSEDYIGQVTMENEVTEYPVVGYSQAEGRRGGMVVGPDGNIWFGVFPQSQIAFVTTSGIVTYIDTPSSTRSPIIGPDGNIWFAGDGLVGTVDVSTHEVETWPTQYDTDFMTIGSDGDIWFAEFGPKIGKVTTSGEVTEIDTTAEPNFLVLGDDGNIWFGVQGDALIGRVTPAGVVTELTTSDQTQYLMNGNGGTVWFATQGSQSSGSLGTVVAARSALEVSYRCAGTSSCEAAPGSTVQLAASVANHGPSDAGAVEVRFSLSGGLTLTSISGPTGWTCEPAAGGAICAIGQLADAASATIDLEVEVGASLQPGTSGSSAANISSAAPNPDPAGAHAEVVIEIVGSSTTTTPAPPKKPLVPRFTG